MYRLTKRKGGLVSLIEEAYVKDAVEMLCEYEDLEMTPSEIDEMRLELCDLRAQLESQNKPVTAGAQPNITRSDILNAAMRCVCGDREQDYGSPESSFRMIAALWEPFLKQKCVSPGAELTISPEDVAAMMALFKIARIATGHGKADSWVDGAGYLACGGEIEAAGIATAQMKVYFAFSPQIMQVWPEIQRKGRDGHGERAPAKMGMQGLPGRVLCSGFSPEVLLFLRLRKYWSGAEL